MKLHETIKRVYSKILKPIFKIEVLSDKGWEEISSLNIIENAEVYEIQTQNGAARSSQGKRAKAPRGRLL